jgi:poly(3-hydroxybutyrate) depolymerase
MRRILISLALFLFAAMTSISALAASGHWQSGKIAGLDVFVYIPLSHGQGPSALMINLHGCAQSPEDLKNSGNWPETADATNMIVALPRVPNGGKYFGCWDYYGANHTDRNRDNRPLIALTEQLIAEPSLAIDPRQVYVSGLSAGATEAILLGCLRPDLFAGIAVNSGPALGTTANDLHSPPRNASMATQLCTRLAGARSPYLASQVASLIVGDRDFVVDAGHSKVSAQMFESLYGASAESALDTTKLKGANTQGRGILVSDSQGHVRVSFILNAGLGHAWPAGDGTNANGHAGSGGVGGTGGGTFVSGYSIDYPAYLAAYFRATNLRLR